MRFEDSRYLWIAAAIIGLVIGIYYLTYRKRHKIIVGDLSSKVFTRLMPSWNGKFWPANTAWIVGGIGLCAFSLANPQWGNQTSKISAKGIDLYIALDISNSMLATDVSPSRLEKAKKILTDFVQNVSGYRIGLIYFAGSAYLQMPISADLSVAQLLLKSANTYQAGNQGTSISDAIDMALATFEQENQNSKVVLIVTDGETHDEASITSAKKAADLGVYVYCIGVGTSEGGPIPYGNGYKLDENNQIVNTALNKELIKDVADAGAGGYSYIDNNKYDIQALMADIEDKAKESISTTETYSSRGSRYQWPLGLGLALLLVGFFYSPSKQKV